MNCACVAPDWRCHHCGCVFDLAVATSALIEGARQHTDGSKCRALVRMTEKRDDLREALMQSQAEVMALQQATESRGLPPNYTRLANALKTIYAEARLQGYSGIAHTAKQALDGK